ncbi:MAG: FG-GAP-like repeat-containing protein [Nitrospirota bacterium]
MVASVEITPASPSGDIGGTVQFTAVARDAQGKICGAVTFSWSSSDNSIVIVNSSGLATLLFSGDPADYPAPVIITATANGTAMSDTATLTVTNPVDHVIVTPDPASMTTCVDPPLQFTAVAEDSSNNPLAVQPPFFWNSSDTGVATISGAGLATAVAAGVTQITATAYGIPSLDVPLTVSGGASITVTVTPNPLTLPAGSDDAFNAVVAGFSADDSVTWSVDDAAPPANGTIDPTGPNDADYHAPPIVPTPATVTVRATSNENPACSGTADITIIPTFTQSTEVDLGQTEDPQALVIGQFNTFVDSDIDIAVANQGSNNVSVLLGDGAGGLTLAGAVSTSGSDPVSLAQGFFDAGALPDLAVVNFASDTVASLLGTGAGSFNPATPATYGVGTSPQSVAAGDFDNDGSDDLAVANFFSEDVTILGSNGDGTFTATETISLPGSGPWAIAGGFIDGDVFRDLAVVDLTDDTIWILLGDGDGTFTAFTSISLPAGTGPAAVTMTDFDGVFTDLAIVNQGTAGASCPPIGAQNTVTILLGLGNGFFAAPTTENVGSNPRAIASGDFDQDGAADLSTANYCGDSISVLFGNGDGTFQTAASYFPNPSGQQSSDLPTGLAVEDFDGDGFPDIAVTNSRLQTIGNSQIRIYTVSILLNAN